MRPVVVLVLLAILAACGSSSSSGSDADSDATLSGKAVGAKTCVEVRTGIDAFNAKDYANTVTHFKKAEVLAKLYAKKSPGKTSSDLLQAVDYYAHLPAKAYPKAALSSSEFARFKAITLGQCEPVEGPTPDPQGTDT